MPEKRCVRMIGKANVAKEHEKKNAEIQSQ